WVVEKGGIIHHDFARQIGVELAKPDCKISDPFRHFWELVRIESQRPAGWLDPVAAARAHGSLQNEALDTVNRAIFLRSLAPRYQLNTQSRFWKTYKEVMEIEHKIESLADLVEIKIVLANDHLVHSLPASDQSWPLLAELLDPLTSLLANAVQMGVDAAYADIANGMSYSAWRSIEPHRQDQFSHPNGWSTLGELCRRSFEEACILDSEMARITVDRWIFYGQSKGYSLFRRLALHAFAYWQELLADQAIPLLLEGNTLWDNEYHREVCRFLVRRGTYLSNNALEQLILEILKGKPRTLYREDLDDESFRKYSTSATDKKLAKLLQGGASLDAESRQRAEIYLESLSDEEKRDDRDEFIGWVGDVVDIPQPTADDWMDLSPQEIVDRMTQPGEPNSWEQLRQPDPGRKLADLMGRDWQKAFKVICLSLDQGVKIEETWSSGLHRLSVNKENTVLIVSELWRLVCAHPHLLQAVNGLASITMAVSETLHDDPEPVEFWSLWDAVWEQFLIAGRSVVATDVHGLSWAINHPGANLTKALLARLDQRKRDAGSGLPSDLKSRFDDMAAGKTETHRAARILLASHLAWLHYLDPIWTTNSLIQRMVLQENGAPTDEAMGMWEGYLWSSSLNINLLSDIKQAMLTALPRIEPGTNGSLDNLHALFADILIELPSGFSESEIKSAFGAMTQKGLVGCARHFEKKLKIAGDKSPDLWQHSIKPLIQKFWPVDREHRTPTTSASLVGMLLAIKRELQNGLDLLNNKGLLEPFDDHYLHQIIYHLDQKQLHDSENNTNSSFDVVLSFPTETLELLDTVIPRSPQHLWSLDGLDSILQKIISQQPQLQSNPAYRRLIDLLNRG
ncbi:MAG: hypothetical protein HQL64_16795, partial [Magnetococcales bacterium]|nr:hypothetical protein [Magnetococcales bacterium]